MDEVKSSAISKMKISEDVIITVAKLAALDVEGVAGLDGVVGKMSKLKGNGPVTVRTIGDVAVVDLRIKVKGGVRVPLVAQEVQNAVKENIQNMTGVTVAGVNVTVAGAVFDDAKEA